MSTTREAFERLHRAFATKDEAGVRAVAAPDVEFVMPGMTTVGVDAYIEVCRVWWNAFPDLELETRKVCVEGDIVVEEGVMVATHAGPMPAPTGEMIPATGRRVELPYVDCFTVRDGVVTSDRLYMDQLTLLGQLGLLPAAAGA